MQMTPISPALPARAPRARDMPAPTITPKNALAFGTAIALCCALPLAAVAADNTRLTVYSGDFQSVLAGNAAAGNADIAQTLRRDVAAGRSEITVTGLPSALDLGGVQLHALGGAQVIGQRYDFATAAPDDVLARARGQAVEVRTAGGDTLRGTLLGAGNGGLTLAGDGGVRVVHDYVDLALPALPDGLASEPTLRFAVHAARAGAQDFELRYPSGGLAWRAEYTATLADGDSCRLALTGAALIANRSGASFDAAALTLIAGEPRRTQAPVAMKAMRADVVMVTGSREYAVAPHAAGDYQAYSLAGTADLPDGSAQRVALIDDANGVACERRYETRAGQRWWGPQQPLIDRDFGGDGEQAVVSTLEFDNAKAVGLGMPLPAGRVRVSEADGDLLGEAQIGHTAAGETLELELGTAFDLRAERKQTDFRLDRSARQMEEDFAIELRNARTTAATIRVIESLPRWSDWEITASSVKWHKLDAQTIAFDVPVRAEGRAPLTYSVRYRWPDTVKP